MNQVLGETRTRVARRHALIAPDGHVPARIPGIEKAVVNVLISPAMGARFTQLLVRFEAGGTLALDRKELQHFLYIESGGGNVGFGGEGSRLGAGGFAYAPAGMPLHFLEVEPGTRVTIFQKPFEQLAGVNPPAQRLGQAGEIEPQPFLGDPKARLQVLLPDDWAFDMAVNIFTYEPGARLPFVETHLMEHGLLMLEGEGVYRLEEAWYPVKAGDCIWMAPYCPQWFVAMGDGPARYLYYKDINRPPQ